MPFQGGWTGAARTAGHIKMKSETRAEPTGMGWKRKVGADKGSMNITLSKQIPAPCTQEVGRKCWEGKGIKTTLFWNSSRRTGRAADGNTGSAQCEVETLTEMSRIIIATTAVPNRVKHGR